MEKRVVFRSSWLPWLLLLPQMAVILVFFFWPAAQALLQSLQQQDPFGTSVEFVGLANFRQLLDDPSYVESFKTTAFFSVMVAGLGISLSLVLAVFADRITRGGMFYKTMLVLPYAVAPAVAAVLWVFMFSPSLGVVAYALGKIGINWNHLLDSGHAMTLIVMASVWKQISYNFLFFLAGLQSIPQIADRGRRDRRCKTLAPLLDHPVPAAVADDLLPAGHQRGLRLLRHLRDRRCRHAGRAGQGHGHPGLQGVLRRLQGHGPGRLGRTVGGADGDRGGPDGHPVPLRREKGSILMFSKTHVIFWSAGAAELALPGRRRSGPPGGQGATGSQRATVGVISWLKNAAPTASWPM
jgi:hypothetical protein